MTPLAPYPHRIVCLAAEAPEILARLGAFDRIVGVSGFARQPTKVRHLPKVDVFRELASHAAAASRVIEPDAVIQRRPELIIAS